MSSHAIRDAVLAGEQLARAALAAGVEPGLIRNALNKANQAGLEGGAILAEDSDHELVVIREDLDPRRKRRFGTSS